jgi:hypothetical protein
MLIENNILMNLIRRDLDYKLSLLKSFLLKRKTRKVKVVFMKMENMRLSGTGRVKSNYLRPKL